MKDKQQFFVASSVRSRSNVGPFSVQSRGIRRFLALFTLIFTLALGNAWATDYYLINGNDNSSTATLNTVDFWTQGTFSAKSNGGTDYKKCIVLGGNVSAGITNVSYPTRYISYGVKTTSVKLTLKVYQSNNSNKKINIYEVNEAANGSLTITNTQEESVSKGFQTIEFTATPAAGTRSTIYITSQAASNFEFYQVTASETGSSLTNLIGGRAGYAIDYSKKSRLATKSGEDAMLDGVLYYHLSSDYKPNNGTSVQLKTGNYIKFGTIEPVLLTVVTTSANKFYVAKTADGTTNEKAATATHKIKLETASDWYIVGGASSATQISKISFSPLYAVTYAAGTGTGTMDAAYGYEGEEIPLPTSTFTPPTGQEFSAWVVTKTVGGASVSVTDGKFTMPAEAVTVTATWAAATPKYTVVYKDEDGTTNLGSEEVEVGEHPTATGITATKDWYTFASWQLNSSDIALDAASWTSVAKDATVTLTARYTGPNYFTTSVDFEEGGSDAVSGIAAKNIVASAAGEYDGGKANENWAYKGWKIKSNGATVKVFVQAGKKLTYKFGYLAATGHVNITNDATTYDVTGASSVQDNPLKYTTYSWVKNYDAVYTFTTGSSSAAVIKAMIVEDVYNVTYTDGTGDASGSASNVTEVTLPAPTETVVGSLEFDGWKANQAVTVDDEVVAANTKIEAGKVAVLSANTTFTAQWKAVTTKYAITEATPSNGSVDADLAEAEAGATVTIIATPNTDYLFDAWDVYKTGDADTKVAVTETAGVYTFTMPAYAVTVNATFAEDSRKKILYLTTTSEADTKANDKLYAALKDAYNVKIAAPDGQTLTNYDLVILHESISGTNTNSAVTGCKTTTVPVLNTKSYFYNNANTTDQRWNWGTPNAGTTVKGCTPNAAYCNIADHPIFAGVINEGFIEITDEAAQKCMQPIGAFTTGKEGYTLATTPNASEGNGCAIHELTPAQRGVASGKYLMISVSNAKLNALNANGQKLFQNAVAYLIDGTASWTPADPKTVTHTLTNATKASGEDAVCAGVAYSATYEAVSGYTLPATVTVKVDGSAINSGYTWNQATGVLAIEAAQVTANIEVVVNAEFNCPAAGSGDVVFSWTPKDGMADKSDIAAGSYDLPGEWLESIVGGSAVAYLPGENKICIRNSRLAYNGDYAYIKLNVCALKEGDKIVITSPAAANNIWVSTSTTRPADADAAAAVIEQGTAFYIPNASALIDATEIYLWRAASLTEIGTVTITRPHKYTVTYASEDLSDGAVPAAVEAFDGQKIIVAGQGTMVNGAKNFTGWNDGANDYVADDELTVTSNVTLTAQWVACTPLTLNLTGYATELLAGGATTTATLDKGASTGTVTWESSNTDVLTVENGVITPVKGGMATVTAHVAEDGTYCADDVTSTDITVKATVHYEANGGAGTMTDGVGALVTVVANEFTYADHKFLRWNTQEDGLGVDVAVGATTNENMTLYAIWKEINCPTGANIYSIEFTNTSNVNLADGADPIDLATYATIEGGSASMKYFKSGSNANVLTYSSNVSKAAFSTNAQYMKVELDCPLQKGDVITAQDCAGNQLAIASALVADNYPLSGTKETTSDGVYEVLENDNIEGFDVLYIGRATSSGTLTFTELTIYRPAPDAPVPTITTDPVNASYTGSDPILPMTVVADATGAKDLHYQWYKVGDPSDVEVGDDAASYTPIASGEYYCVVTNSPAGYTAKSATSGHATITMVSSDATLAWLKADGNTIELTAGVYDYEYVIADDATVAPTITAGKNEEHAVVTITPADTKTGTARVHVVAEDGTTYHNYTVKFNEFSGCKRAYWFAYADDAATNSVTNNSTMFTSAPTGSNSGSKNITLETGWTVTTTKKAGAPGSTGQFVVPSGYCATFYAAVKGSGSSGRYIRLKQGNDVKYSSAEFGNTDPTVVKIEGVAAGTYTIYYDGGMSNFYLYAAEYCKYPVTGVSLPATESVYKDQSITLTPTFTPAEASNKNVTWTTADASIATVENGVVTGKAAGTVNITVTTEDGGYQAVCVVTVTEIDCDTYVGNLFSLVMKDVAVSNISVGTDEIDMSTYANIASGDAHIAMTSSSKSVPVAYNQNSQVQFCYNSGNLYMRLALPHCGLKVGDVITITSTENNEFCFTTSATRSTTYSTKNKKYMVQVGDDLVGANEIYVWRASGSNTYLRSISIDRGVSAPFDANRTSLKVNSFGTFCYPQGVAEGMYAGATFYRILEKTGVGFVLEEVRSLVAGRPYMFVAEANTIYVVWNNDAVTAPVNDDLNYGLVGANFDDDYTPVPSYYDGRNCYILKNNHIYLCGNNCTISKYRAYIDYDAVPEAGQGTPGSAPAGAPALRRIVCGRDNATAIDNISENSDELTIKKVMIDGQMYILRGEKMYDATGRLVK